MRIVVTQGMPEGIGPEIVLKALPLFSPPEGTRVTLLGDPALFAEVARALDLPLPADLRPVSGALEALEESVRLVRNGEADAIVTAPVNKAALKAEGFAFPGQTEFFADRFAAESYAMMLACGDLRVVPVTTHIALSRVAAELTEALLLDRIRTVAESLRREFGIAEPRLAVLGLNPHAGESGHFGDEEIRVIHPAIRTAREEGIAVVGPLPADAALAPRARARYDALLGMYHDQVLAPYKALSGGTGVNLTLGLGTVRTSPDHGTAEDIAGKGVADPVSMLAALDLATLLVGTRNRAEFRGRAPPRP